MAHPLAPKRADALRRVGQVFGTPLVINGWSWLPFNQLIAWGVFTGLSMRKNPARSLGRQIGLGGAKMVVFLGSEWCHNLAHVAAARWVGRPTDALLIFMGMPLVLYDQPEAPEVTPREHILRSLGGPAVNALLMFAARLLRLATRPGTGLREVADTAVGMNTFLCTASLVPHPNFDGGPLLKWGLVSRGRSPAQAEAGLRAANRVAGAGLAGAAGVALGRRKWLAGVVMASLAGACLIYGWGKSAGHAD